MLVYLIVAVIVLCLIDLVINYNEKARTLKKIPGPKDIFITGNTLEALLNPVELFSIGRTYAKTFDGIYRFWGFGIGAINVYNPGDIEKVIATTKHNDKSLIYKFLKPWLQEGLLLSKGRKWHERRKILTPAFHFNILRQFYVILEANSKLLVETLQKTKGVPTDISPVISEFTLSSICETAMGTRLQGEKSARSYKDAIYELGPLLVNRFVKPYYFFDSIFNPTPLGRRQFELVKTLHDFTGKVIKERKNYIETSGMITVDVNAHDSVFMSSKKKKTAMLDLLISAEKEGLIDETGIQEEVDTFMFEGHDTTASGLTFCLMSLANHKDIQEKIKAELYEIFGDSNRTATMEDLGKMKYLECCIKESLRLYPPVHFISRNIDESIELSNYTIPAGVFCHIHIFDLHRREDLFKDPLVFDPDRFLPENSVGRHPYAYIPFSAGPRNCIGQKFAIMEMKSCLSAILRNFDLLPITKDSDLRFTSDFVLRAADPIYVKFVERNN